MTPSVKVETLRGCLFIFTLLSTYSSENTIGAEPHMSNESLSKADAPLGACLGQLLVSIIEKERPSLSLSTQSTLSQDLL